VSHPSSPHRPIKGYQVQVSDGEGELLLFGRGIMAPRFSRKPRPTNANEVTKTSGAWQKLVVELYGPRLEVALNVIVIPTASSLALQSGYPGLLGKNGSVAWRELKLKQLP
jgi:hypothetical protein